MLAGLGMTGCVTSTTKGAPGAVTPMPPGSRVVMLEPLAHPADSYAARDLKDFATDTGRGYFGAFAVSDVGMPAHVTGYHNRAEAAKSAIFWCRKNGGDRSCKVIAERLPLTDFAEEAVPMSERANAAFTRYQGEAAPKAFALGKEGAYSLKSAGLSLDEARRLALRDCNKESGWGKPTPGNCRIIDQQN
ncbi:MAG: hypothetical protein E6Q73_05005 [Pseudorhodobacter sp.]|nr:MAG: hypothetical protein E6Q73_05005 [Pseudorhodobacter sp.]